MKAVRWSKASLGTLRTWAESDGKPMVIEV